MVYPFATDVNASNACVAAVLAQTVLAPVDLEAGSCCVLFVQTLGGAIIFGLGQSVYLNDYNKKIMDISGLPNPGAIVTGGITAFRVSRQCSFLTMLFV